MTQPRRSGAVLTWPGGGEWPRRDEPVDAGERDHRLGIASAARRERRQQVGRRRAVRGHDDDVREQRFAPGQAHLSAVESGDSA